MGARESVSVNGGQERERTHTQHREISFRIRLERPLLSQGRAAAPREVVPLAFALGMGYCVVVFLIERGGRWPGLE
jgi:hypothetical protein